MAKIEQYHAVGRRKAATARVFMRPGTGKIVVNKENADDYFDRDVLMMVLRQPLLLTETSDKVDIICNVNGGGKTNTRRLCCLVHLPQRSPPEKKGGEL